VAGGLVKKDRMHPCFVEASNRDNGLTGFDWVRLRGLTLRRQGYGGQARLRRRLRRGKLGLTNLLIVSGVIVNASLYDFF
jgi:hypothetical protein